MIEIDILENVKSKFELDGCKPNEYSPLTLAFIGDSVYGMMVKTVIVLRGNCPANKLNEQSVKYVKAVNQARIVDFFLDEDILNEEEEDILRRGRNAKASSTAKNASVGDYRKATGLEALFGYLYLKNDNVRMIELLKIAIDMLDGE